MIDLHTHSTYSDGTFSPMQLVEYAKKKGITTLALTDHDCIGGVREASMVAKQNKLRFVSGVELSVLWKNKALHVLGLNIDINNQALIDLLEIHKCKRLERAKLMAHKLEELGLENSLAKATQMAPGGLVARPHFARVLVQEGWCKDFAQAFKRYLKQGRPAYVPTDWVNLEKGVATITQAGGVAVLAHPLRYRLTQTKLRELIADFKLFGGMGMEVIAGMSSKQEIFELSALCQKFDLLASVGSDFHGEHITPDVMNRLTALPDTCRSILEVLPSYGENE